MNWHAVLQNLWRKACEWEGIDPSTRFAVFSPNNNYANFYNALARSLAARGPVN